jgi:hypothetical protein
MLRKARKQALGENHKTWPLFRKRFSQWNPIAQEHSLWKLLGLALVSTRGTKLRYWKQFFTALRTRIGQVRS